MLKQMKQLYDSLPKEKMVFLKYIPDRVLFGKSYFAYQNKISFNKSDIDKNLLKILLYAREYTDFGRDNIPPNLHIYNVGDVLESMPLVSSLDISNNLEYYISKEYNFSNSYKALTGGVSTDRAPANILLANESYGIEWAHIHYIWSHLGYDRKSDIKLSLRGKNLEKGKIVEYNPVYNEIVVDPFKINENNAKRFIEEIKKFDIKFIHGYPSYVKEFMTYFKKYEFNLNIKGIFLGSEGASVEDKKEFEVFFGAKVVHWYGLTEKVALAVDYEGNNVYKVFTSYGYPRIVDGELVATTFINKALPLINYKTGDGAELFEDENSLYIKNLKGREGKDFIYIDKKKKIPILNVEVNALIKERILLHQTYQDEFGKIEIRVLPKPGERNSLEKIINELGRETTKLKDTEFKIEFKIVNENEIQRSHRGKLIHLIQKLKV